MTGDAFAQMRKAFGDRGIVEMVLVAGAYHTVRGLLNRFEVPPPEERPAR